MDVRPLTEDEQRKLISQIPYLIERIERLENKIPDKIKDIESKILNITSNYDISNVYHQENIKQYKQKLILLKSLL